MEGEDADAEYTYLPRHVHRIYTCLMDLSIYVYLSVVCLSCDCVNNVLHRR